jgi:hypothetical protein
VARRGVTAQRRLAGFIQRQLAASFRGGGGQPGGQVLKIAPVGGQRQLGQPILDPQAVEKALEGRLAALQRCGLGRDGQSSESFCCATTRL